MSNLHSVTYVDCLTPTYLRHPQDIILSFDIAEKKTGITEPFTQQMIGMKTLYQVFQQIELITGQTPLVIHSDDIIKTHIPHPNCHRGKLLIKNRERRIKTDI